MPCNVVVPSFKSEAQRSPTEPFFEKFVLISPLSFFPPLISKSIDPDKEIIFFWYLIY